MKSYCALLAIILLLPVSRVMAQLPEPDAQIDVDLKATSEAQAPLGVEASTELDTQLSSKSSDASQSQAPAKRPAQIKEATITLQTTVTGNQEQPRVLYILPWQSPLMGDVEFQTLISQQEEVFGHLEREELRRTLEAVEAMDKAK